MKNIIFNNTIMLLSLGFLIASKNETYSEYLSSCEEVKMPPNQIKENEIPLIADSIRKNSVEEKALNKIWDLIEVKRANSFIDSISGHKHGVALMVISRPNKDQDYYLIQVGYNGDLRFEVYFNFYVYPKAGTVKYYDVMNEKILTIDDWRNSIVKGKLTMPF